MSYHVAKLHVDILIFGLLYNLITDWTNRNVDLDLFEKSRVLSKCWLRVSAILFYNSSGLERWNPGSGCLKDGYCYPTD